MNVAPNLFPSPISSEDMQKALSDLRADSKSYQREIGLLKWAFKYGRKALRKMTSVLKRTYRRDKPYFVSEAEGVRFIGDFGDAYARGCALGWQNEHVTAAIIAENYLGDGAYVDVGTNMGLLACHVARRLPNAPIYCFEPHPDTCRRAAGTLALNDVQDARLYQAAVSDEPGTLPLFIERGRSEGCTLGASVVKHANQRVDVLCVTLDDLVAQDNLKVGFLKVDVEGFEPQVFRGAKRLLAEQHPPILFEINFPIADKLGWTQQDIAKQLGEFGYTKFTPFDGEGRQLPWPASPDLETINVLALPSA